MRIAAVGCLRIGATVPLASFSGADGFDDARAFRTLLAQKRISEELAKRRFSFHAQKLLQPSALDGNFLQGPCEQRVESRQGASGAQLPRISPCSLMDSPCVSLRVGKVINADEDNLLVWSSRTCPDQTPVFFLGQADFGTLGSNLRLLCSGH